MSRPCKQRRICCHGEQRVLKPAGRSLGQLELEELQLDELEALRLCDLRGLHQQEAADLMGVSRPTLGRIVESGRHKLARLAVEEGTALRIGGGNVTPEPEQFRRRHAHCQRHGGNGGHTHGHTSDGGHRRNGGSRRQQDS